MSPPRLPQHPPRGPRPAASFGKVVATYLPRPEYEQLEQRAKATNTSISGTMREMVRSALRADVRD